MILPSGERYKTGHSGILPAARIGQLGGGRIKDAGELFVEGKCSVEYVSGPD